MLKLCIYQLETVKFFMKVDAVQHFLYGIAIDEGYGGNRANILAWDVLYPEVIYLDVNYT